MDTHILVVDDNREMAYGLRTNLEFEGYQVTVAADGAAGLEAALTEDVDLVILDLMLPELDGFHLLRDLRGKGSRIPVLILSARDEEADKVRGLRAGADDYVTKPFDLMELLARVNALLRRARSPGEDNSEEPERWKGPTLEGPFHFGEVVVDPAPRTVFKGEEEVSLTPKEFDLLVALLRRDGTVASRDELLREVWNYRAAVPSRTVDTHVAELRRKLEDDPSNPEHIITVRKVGYRFQP